METGEGSVLERLSMQSQQIRAEVYKSLQNMRQERAKLQSSLREMDETTGDIRKIHQNEVSMSWCFSSIKWACFVNPNVTFFGRGFL